MEFRPLKIKPPSPERTTRMHLFTALLPPGVLEYCIESPEKIALELNNFFILPYKKNHPTIQAEKTWMGGIPLEATTLSICCPLDEIELVVSGLVVDIESQLIRKLDLTEECVTDIW